MLIYKYYPGYNDTSDKVTIERRMELSEQDINTYLARESPTPSELIREMVERYPHNLNLLERATSHPNTDYNTFQLIVSSAQSFRMNNRPTELMLRQLDRIESSATKTIKEMLLSPYMRR